ncbi:hypothetical protein [Streptosporangium sp. H16]|uniref:hypothetical protein n=1 Tax=Streptosporangium sp. H16 TaxID=3444184 RepID=UPI003F7AD665
MTTSDHHLAPDGRAALAEPTRRAGPWWVAGISPANLALWMAYFGPLQVLPAAEGRAEDLGVINIANSGPQVLGPVIAGPIVAGLGGYPVLYLTSAALALLGAGLVWKVRSVP